MVLLVIFWNYYANTGVINDKTVGEVSDNLNTLFTPAGYAFSIWGIIFLGLIVNAIYQIKIAFSQNTAKQKQILTGPWLILANIANGVWLWFWLNEYIGISVLVMIMILFSLIMVELVTGLKNYKTTWAVLVLGWWPITIYLGWISVATIANIAAYFAYIGWAEDVNQVLFTNAMLGVATLINLFILFTRKLTAFGWVSVWAFIAIAVKNNFGSIYITAIICACIIAVFSIYLRNKFEARIIKLAD